MQARYPFKNLVFQGGGVKVLAYRGALEVLESHGILPHIDRIAGTSAGGLLATLISFRLSVEETFNVLNTLDFSRIPNLRNTHDFTTKIPNFVAPYLDRITRSADAFSRMVMRYGWYSTQYAQRWTENVIAQRCDGDGLATFAEFRKRGFRDLYIVVTNLSQRSVQVFSADSTPDVPVAHAVIVSQCIPLFFEAMRFDGNGFGNGDYLADGGVLSNYPLHLFDSPAFQKTSRWFIAGVNWETLGCRLYTPNNCPRPVKPITNLLDYVQCLVETLLEAQEVAYNDNLVDHQRTINISNCCVQATDFDIFPGDPRHEKLLVSGREAAQAFLQQYTTPTRHVWQWVKQRVWQRWA